MDNKFTLQDRLNYSEQLKAKYPDYIPVIIRKKENDKILQDIDKNKYLIPKNLDINGLVYIIRKKVKPSENQAIFIFVQKKCKNVQTYLVPMNKTVNDLYNEYSSEDNLLYIIYTTENTFG